jgi:aspartyl-tRNA(Asn)/glutamyl-tRNA(Gln) amidotransferase subunit A
VPEPFPPASAIQIRDAVAARRISAREAVSAALDAATRLNPSLNAFLQLFPEQALAHAAAIDARVARGGSGGVGPLAGVPVALKDNICLGPDLAPAYAADPGRTTCASRILESYHSPFSATVARRLIDAGAVIIGKTNLDEFAMGSSGEHSAFGPVRNPWDPTRVPGGSSAGSAAAVAAGIVPIALGSDTGGSIRQPAGMCNIVGMKPTYGRVSRYGLVAFASSLDQIGPFARTVSDAALALSAIVGFDRHDSTSADVPLPDFFVDLESPFDGLVIGVPKQARSSANDWAVAQATDNAIAVFRDAGATIVDIDLPHIDLGVAAYYIIAPAEASSNLARFDAIRYGRRADLRPDESLFDLYARSRAEGFGPEVQRRIMLGTHVLSSGYYDAYYTTALKVRRLIKNDYDAAFAQGCHAVLMPSSPTPAFKIGEKINDPLALYLEDIYTVGVNLAGLPAITLPAGFTKDEPRLPVGIQLIAPPLGEKELFQIARMFERATGFASSAAPRLHCSSPAPSGGGVAQAKRV